MYSKKNILNFDWVLIDELAVGAIPRKDSHLLLLKKNKIKSIFTLCSEAEGQIPEACKNQFVCKNYFIPDHKSKLLPNIEQLNEALKILENLLKNGPVYLHCFAGVERSPLLCIAYLMMHKSIDKQNALEYLMQIHPSTNPLKGQLALLDNL